MSIPKEIELKFLVKEEWNPQGLYYEEIRQGYLRSYKDKPKKPAIRVRTKNNIKGFLNIKGSGLMEKTEFDYKIPFDHANYMIDKMCDNNIIIKKRYKIIYPSLMIEVDVFEGNNKGLILAEIELKYIGQSYPKPIWLGKEVTNDEKYYNYNLAHNPYSLWKENDTSNKKN